MVSLNAFISEWAQRAWVPGVSDCSAFVAAWASLRSGRDAYAGFRGRYDTDEEADEIVRTCGGLAVLFRRVIADLGPVDWGGVVPAVTTVRGRETGALAADYRVFVFTPRGIWGSSAGLLPLERLA